MTVITPNDTVRVTNTGEKAHVIGWNNRYYKLEPGKDAHVPIEAVMNAFGDPRAATTTAYLRPDQGGTGLVPDRNSEIRRLAQLYGLEVQQLKDHATGEAESPRPIPTVEVYTLAGERLHTVLEDLPGDWTISAALPTQQEVNATDEVIAHLQRQVEFLMSKLTEATPKNSFDELPADEINPTSEPKSKAKSSVKTQFPEDDGLTLP